MKPSRLVAGIIAGGCGMIVGIALISLEHPFLLTEINTRVIFALSFGAACGVFRLADRFGLVADPFSNDANRIYDEKPESRT